MNTYFVDEQHPSGGVSCGVTVSLKMRFSHDHAGSSFGELMRHFPSGDNIAARAYATRLGCVAAILNGPIVTQALAAAADALDMAQAQVDSDRDRKVLLAAMYAAREAAKSL